MRSNLAAIRWKGHTKCVRVQKGIRFRPEYARLLERVAEEKGICQREVVEQALEEQLQAVDFEGNEVS